MLEAWESAIETLTALFEKIVLLLNNIISTISDTADRIDSINFEESGVFNYLGYAHNAMGDPLYSLFTTVCLISLGVTMWTYLLKGIGYIKNILPW